MPISPDDIPTSVTQLVYTAPWVGDPKYCAVKLSQNEIAEQLAHYWPAIEQHIREQVAQEIEAEAEKTADENTDFGLYLGARIARSTNQPTTEETPR
ncbi:hypothetical protein [Kitasatospora griseola]|uniref:hypothetical protein n=1 Tax=Kitasatospora griseola TaxID=2064 RepID=UPI00365ACF51